MRPEGPYRECGSCGPGERPRRGGSPDALACGVPRICLAARDSWATARRPGCRDHLAVSAPAAGAVGRPEHRPAESEPGTGRELPRLCIPDGYLALAAVQAITGAARTGHEAAVGAEMVRSRKVTGKPLPSGAAHMAPARTRSPGGKYTRAASSLSPPSTR
jgi:hypothetical protein